MLTNVVVVAPLGASWPDFTIPVLASGGPNGLFLSKVDGLNPVQSAVTSQKYGIADGEYYTGSSVGKRNIVLYFGIESRFDAEAARDQLYAFFLTKRPIRLRFVFDHRAPVEIEGYYETHEGDRFVQDLEMQISIVCPRPNFIDPAQQVAEGLTGIAPGWTMLLNNGNQSIGVLVRVSPDPVDILIGEVIFEVMTPDGFSNRHLSITPNFVADPYEIILNSNQGAKGIQIWDPTTDDSLNGLIGMTEDSAWPILHPGGNSFRIRTPDSSTARQWTAWYYNEYGGV